MDIKKYRFVQNNDILHPMCVIVYKGDKHIVDLGTMVFSVIENPLDSNRQMYCINLSNGKEAYFRMTPAERILHPVFKDENEFRKYARELRQTIYGDEYGTCSYAGYGKYLPQEEYNVANVQFKDVCHARMSSNAISVDYLVDFIDPRAIHKDGSWNAWYSYIANESPWSIAVKTKSSAIALRYGILYNTGYEQGIVKGAAIAIRMGTEYKDVTKRFVSLKKLGLTSHQAFLLACHTLGTLENKNEPIKVDCHEGGHRVTMSSRPFQMYVRFLENGFKIKERKHAFNNGISVTSTVQKYQGSKRDESLGCILRGFNRIEGVGFAAKQINCTVAESALMFKQKWEEYAK